MNDEWKADVTKLDCGGYVIRYRPAYFSSSDEDRPICVEFEAYKIIAPWYDDLSVNPKVRRNEILMEALEPGGRFGTTTSFEDASCFLRGSIKWDGCSNWEFVNDGCMIHFCGPEGHREVNEAFEKMYEIAGDIMGDHEWNREKPHAQ